ncbi:hypothetical protein AB0G02_38910, partial [Actinosynnema sp. NPDC023658]|uniref:hypothetical protein n=1 Tax=Actinosynnema sp. NPDC023658 TaxID=3155465 RepID=UPI0033FF2FF8
TTIASLLAGPAERPPAPHWLHVEATPRTEVVLAEALRLIDDAAGGDTSLTARGTDSHHQVRRLLCATNIAANLDRLTSRALVDNGLRYDRRVTDRVGALGVSVELAAPRLVTLSDDSEAENSLTGGSYSVGLDATSHAVDLIVNTGANARPSGTQPQGLGGANALVQWAPWQRMWIDANLVVGLVDRNRITPPDKRSALVAFEARYRLVAESRNSNTLHDGALGRSGAVVELPDGVFLRVEERVAVQLGLLEAVEGGPAAPSGAHVLRPPRMLRPGSPGTPALGLVEPGVQPELSGAVWDLVEEVDRRTKTVMGHRLLPESVLDDLMNNLQRLTHFSSPNSVLALLDTALDGGVPLLLHQPGRAVGKKTYQVTLHAHLDEEPRFVDVVNDGVSIEHALVDIRKRVKAQGRGSSWNALLRTPFAHAFDTEEGRPADLVGAMPTAGVGGASRTVAADTTSDEVIRLRGVGGVMALYELPVRFELVVEKGDDVVSRVSGPPRDLVLRTQADAVTSTADDRAPFHSGIVGRPAGEGVPAAIRRGRGSGGPARPGRASVE